MSERLYGTVGEKSLNFLKILHPLFQKTLPSTRINPPYFLGKPYRLFPVTYVHPLRCLGRKGRERVSGWGGSCVVWWAKVCNSRVKEVRYRAVLSLRWV